MPTLDAILAILRGRKVYDETTGLWRVYDDAGVEIADSSGILLRGLHGFLLRQYVVDEQPVEQAAGHWKHLFTPAYGVTAPAVTVKCAPAYRIALPDVARISILAETRSVSSRHSPRFRVAAPFVGTVTVQVGEECGSAFRTVKPRCGGQTSYSVRCNGFSRGSVVKPSTGCTTCVEFGFIRHYGTVLRPSTIQNPTEEMLMALW